MEESGVIKVGSKVAHNRRFYAPDIYTVIGETATQWKVATNYKGERRYNKATLRAVGGEYSDRIRLATQDDFDEVEKERLIANIERYKFSTLPLGTLRKIKELLS